MVAKAEDVAQTTPGLSLHEIAIVAMSVLEVMDAPDLETITSGSDWALAVAADLAWKEVDALDASDTSPRAIALRERLHTLHATIASSPWRHPLLAYEELFDDATPDLVRMKELPPMPDPAALALIGRRLRPALDALEAELAPHRYF